MSAALTAATVCLWLVASLATLTFLFATAVRPSQWWQDENTLANIRKRVTINFLEPHPIVHDEDEHLVPLSQGAVAGGLTCPAFLVWDGDQGFSAAVQWGSVLVACLAAAGLKAIKIHKRSRMYEAMVSDPHVSRWDRFSRVVHRILSYQLPPRKLWNDMVGGMSVLDAMLVCMWLGFTALYLWACTTRKYKQVAESGATGNDWAWQRIIASGEASGTVLLFLCMVLFFPVSRSSLLKTLFGSSFQALIKYHRWMAWGTIWISVGHSCIFFLAWGAEGTLSQNLNLRSQETTKNVMGTVSIIVFVIIALTANSWFRSNYFRIFYPVHITCFTIFVTFAIFHSPYMAYWLLPALVLYAMDRAFRYWQLASNWTRISPEDYNSDGNMVTLRLRWDKEPEAVQPGQTVYLRIPRLSLFYSHPFSVADVGDEGNAKSVILHIRQVNSWTKRLKERLSQGYTMSVQVEGPYESKLDYLHGSPVVVMVAGGTGVTPILGVLRYFARMALSGRGKVPQVYFVWTSRSLAELRLMGAPLLAAATGYSSLKGGHQPNGSSDANDDLNFYDRSSVRPARWLYADVHYTGTELDSKPGQKPAVLTSPSPEKQNGVLHPPHKSASGRLPQLLSARFGKPAVIYAELDPQSEQDPEALAKFDQGYKVAPIPLLAPHPSAQPIRAAASVLLTFICAWGGFLAGNTFISYGMSKTSCGYNFMLQAFVQYICIVCGALIPVFVFQHMVESFTRASARHAVLVPSADVMVDEDYLSTSVTVTPDWVMSGKDCEVGTLELKRGRPKLEALLQRIRDQYAHIGQIDVIVAGPDGLCANVHDLCLQRPGKPDGPELMFRRAAYHT